MYTYDSAIGRSIASDGRWSSVDIGDEVCSVIFTKYRKVYATLSNSFLPQQVSLDLDAIRIQIAGLSITFNEFLVANGNNALPTTNKIPKIQIKVAEYNDAFRAGYKVTPVSPNVAPDANLPIGAKDWLMLTRDSTDFKHWFESVLPTVNGFYHPTAYDVNGGYIIDGMKTMRVSGNNTIGLHSFANLGKIEIIPITPEMITPSATGNPLFANSIITVDQDLTNKTVMLVAGGYLFAPGDQAMNVVGEKSVSISLQNSSYLDRFYESRPYLDLSSLPITPFPTNPDMYLTEEITSDDCIRAYLSLVQSFVVLLDNTSIFTETTKALTAKMPGVFITYYEPKWPMMVGNGMMSNYWAKREGPASGNQFFNATQWVLTCIDGFTQNRLMNTNDTLAQNAVYPNRVPDWPVKHSFGTFLKITSDLVV